MDSVQEVLERVLRETDIGPETIADKLGVSVSTVHRWRRGAQPRPVTEGALREFCGNLLESAEDATHLQLPLRADELTVEARDRVSQVLHDLRETFHRRSRFASRNEALDEISRLFFAHITSLLSGQRGLAGLPLNSDKGDARELKSFVDSALREALPTDLAHDVDTSQWLLRIKETEDHLAADILNAFKPLELDPSSALAQELWRMDVLNEAFGVFLTGSFQDEKELGQYLTPSEVVRFMVQLALRALPESDLNTLCDPRNTADFGLILDPSCGVASFLTQVLHSLAPTVEERHGYDGLREWLACMARDVIVGFDKSERMVRFALTNLATFGVSPTHLRLVNSLATTPPDADVTRAVDGSVRLILTNPPFGAEFNGRDLQGYQIARTLGNESSAQSLDSELLFIERYLRWLAPGGDCVAIVPDSILTNRGPYTELRRLLSKRVKLLSITSLPTVTFEAAGTSTKTSVLHFQKLPADGWSEGRTYFAICDDLGFTVNTRGSRREKLSTGESQLPAILDDMGHPHREPAVGHWVPSAEDADRWDANYHASLPLEVEERLRSPSPSDVTVADVAELVTNRADPRRWPQDRFPYIEIGAIDPASRRVNPRYVAREEAPTRARKLAQPGDVLFSTVRPERRVVAVVRPDLPTCVCTTGLAVLRPVRIDPLTLAGLLQSEFALAQVMRHRMGIAYPAVDEQCLLTVLLPIDASKTHVLSESADALFCAEQRVSELRQSFDDSLNQVIQDWTGA